MSLVLADRVQETTSTTGTGTIDLGGAATQYQSFVDGIGDGNTTYYVILSGNGSDWEVGEGTVTSGSPDTLSRDTILASTNSGSAISLSGTSTVFGDAPASFLTSGGGISNVGAWSGFDAYEPGQVVSDSGQEFICYSAVSAPSGSLSVEAATNPVGFNSVASANISITTTGSDQIIVVLVGLAQGLSSAGITVSSVTSTHLTFTKRDGDSKTASFYSTDLEIWWAHSTAPLTSESITVSFSSGSTYGTISAIAVSGANSSTPWDANGSLPATAFSTSSGTGSATYSTTTNNTVAFFIESTTDTSGYGGSGANHHPTGFTSIGNEPGLSAGGSANYSYIINSTTQSSTTVTSSNSQNNWHVLIDAIAFDADPNTSPADDPDHWLPITGSLNDLSDVVITSPSSGQGLFYDGTKWGNFGVTFSMEDISDSDIESPAEGDTLVWNAGDSHWQNASRFAAPGTVGVATQSGTGLSTWVHQNSATVSDTAAGMLISGHPGSGANISGLYKTAPSTPYTITAKLALTCAFPSSFPHTGIGWYDGSAKLHLVDLVYDTTNQLYKVEVSQWNSTTSFDMDETNKPVVGAPNVWVQIADDGTNVSFGWSADGVNFVALYSVAKSSGFLGSSGYANVVFDVNNQETSGNILGTLISWTES